MIVLYYFDDYGVPLMTVLYYFDDCCVLLMTMMYCCDDFEPISMIVMRMMLDKVFIFYETLAYKDDNRYINYVYNKQC